MSPAGPRVVRGSIAILVGLTAATVGITWLFLGMRAVMEVGGSCADGGPYVSAQPCPDGVPAVMIGGIFGGAAGLLGYAVLNLPAGPRLFRLAWPALFLSLGWNFLEYGLNPPGQDGVDAGQIVVAVIFAAMGSVPLLFLLNRRNLHDMFWADPAPVDNSPQPAVRAIHDLRRHPVGRATSGGSARDGGSGEDAVRAASSTATSDADSADALGLALERMHRLYTEGALTADEYAVAKRRLLGQEMS